MMERRLERPQPLFADAEQRPYLFEVHSVWLQLEPIVADDEDRFVHAASIIESWVGADLRTVTDGFAEQGPYRGLVAWMARAPLLLDYDVSPYPSPARKMAITRKGFGLSCRGGDDNLASPWSARVRCRIPRSAQSDLSVSTFLHVTAPSLHGSADLEKRVIELASALRVRWGCAGLGYSVVTHEPVLALDKMYAHSRAHPGYDLTCDVDPLWDRALRSVSWLTIVGREFPGVDIDDPGFAELPGVSLQALPGAIVLKAGEQPARGDMNRLHLPDAYSAVDRALRKVRAKEGATFPAPWREETSDSWLRRYERSVV
jgi:hypothetical protein